MNYFGLVQGEKVKHIGLRCIFFNEEEVQKKQVYGSFIIEFGVISLGEKWIGGTMSLQLANPDLKPK